MRQKILTTIATVAVFSLAFAYVEASVVVYLRHLLGASQPAINKNEVLLLLPGIAFLEPQTAIKLINNSRLLGVELIREMATLVMLLSVALMAGKRLAEKIAFFFFSFGVWDLFYYVFLRLTLGWPAHWTDLDIFFLLPVPWIGPVFVPIIISSLLIVGTFFYMIKNK